MSKLYKKHYDLIANTLAGLADILDRGQLFNAASRFSHALNGTSTDYDPERFFAACNIEAAPNLTLQQKFKVLLEAGLDQSDALEALHDHGDKFPAYAAEVNTNDDLEIDDKPLFSKSDDGCWVSAWVWVGDVEAGVGFEDLKDEENEEAKGEKTNAR